MPQAQDPQHCLFPFLLPCHMALHIWGGSFCPFPETPWISIWSSSAAWTPKTTYLGRWL